MKKLICLLISIVTLFGLVGCSNKKPSDNSVAFFYKAKDISFQSESGVIKTEYRDVNSDDAKTILNLYFEGPISDELVFPFPDGITIESFDTGPARTSITLSSQINNLSGHELTIACACVAKTVFELTGTRSVEIKSAGGLIGGMQSIILMRNDLVLWDDYFEDPENIS